MNTIELCETCRWQNQDCSSKAWRLVHKQETSDANDPLAMRVSTWAYQCPYERKAEEEDG